MRRDMPELPEGPVTIMFTDVEGSTAMRTSLGDAEADALLKQHDEILRSEIEAHRGHDQKAALGDGFLAVFVSTRRAISCAVGIQRALDNFNRTRAGVPLRVRIGLNTGEVAWQDGHLSGEAVHAASRVCAAAEGGQILISDVTRQLAGTVTDISFLDAGEHDLKGFPRPWRLWEVIWVRETGRVPEQVFVGREKELAALRSRLNAALDGHGSLVLVGGEPGVGKTTLVKQLIREAEQRGALALFGRCYESEGTVPYSPFIEMLEQALSIMPPEIVREDMGADASEVARMVPEIRRRFPDIPDPLDLPPEQQRRYFFNAVGAFVGRGAARFPLVLVLDDVHWADEPTLLLVEHIAHLMPNMRVLAVGTYRDVELDVSRPLAAGLERLVRGRLLERLPVRRFDRDGVARMLEALAGRPAPDTVVDAIFDESEGNPFFVEEVFRHLVEEGKVFDEAGNFRTDLHVDELDVPESVRLVVGRRLERLGPEAQKALAAGAIAGRAFPFSLLEDISDLDSGRLLDIVEEAEAARVIVPEERDGEIHYTFAHELIRQTLLAGMSLLRRQRMHLAVANALERIDPEARETRPSEIANHLLQAGAAAAAERTLEYLERAADRAMQAAAFEEALRAIDDAIAIVDDVSRRAKLMEQKGWAMRALGHFDKCLEIWNEVVRVYEDLDEREAAARLFWEMGYQLVWLGRFPEAFETYAHGLQMIGDDHSPTRALLLGGGATLTGFAGLFEASEAAFAEALELAEDLGDDHTLGRLYWGHCVSLWSHARIPEAIEEGEKAVACLRRAGDLWTLVDALCWLSFPLIMSGRWPEAEPIAEESVALAVKLGHVGGEILGARGVIFSRTMQGATLDEVREWAQRDLDRMQAIDSPWIAQSHAWLSAVANLQGDLEAGLRYAEDAIAVEPASAWSGIGWAYRFHNRALAGDESDCRAMLSEKLPTLLTIGDGTTAGTLQMLYLSTEGCALLGWTKELEALYPIVRRFTDKSPVRPFDGALANRIAGMAASALGRWDEAEQHFRKALEQTEVMATLQERPLAQHWYAEMLLRRGGEGDTDEAARLLDKALDVYRSGGVGMYLRRAERLVETVRL